VRGALDKVRRAVLTDLEEVDVVESGANVARDSEPWVAPPGVGDAPSEPRVLLHPSQPRVDQVAGCLFLVFEDQVDGMSTVEHEPDHRVKEPQVSAQMLHEEQHVYRLRRRGGGGRSR
jgi:hypothetical protein